MKFYNIKLANEEIKRLVGILEKHNINTTTGESKTSKSSKGLATEFTATKYIGNSGYRITNFND